jgi:hypothetical protein
MAVIIMAIKFIEKWKFKLSGRSVPVVKCEDIDRDGRIYTLHLLGMARRRANSLVTTWDSKGWEIDKSAGKVSLIDEKGIEQYAFLVTEEGRTTRIYTKPVTSPNLEEVIGKAATMDDIAEAMDLGKSMKNTIIGLLIGMGIGAFILAPMLQVMLK